MMAFLEGALVALPLVLSVGPGFIAQVETGVNSGYRACASVVGGLYSCALLITTATYLGLVRFLDNPHLRFGLSLVNGCFIIVWGTVKIISSHFPSGPEKPAGRRRAGYASLRCYLSGFFLTLSNPISVFFWINIISLAHLNFGVPKTSLPLFSAGLIVTAVSLDMSKCGLLAKSRKVIKPRVLELVSRALGVVLVVMGAYLIVRVF